MTYATSGEIGLKWPLNLNNVRLRNKMLIIYALCVFIPIVLTNVVFYAVTTGNVQNQRIKDVSRALEQMRNAFEAEIDETVSISSVFNNDYNLNVILETEYELPAAYVEAYDSYYRRILNSYTPVYTSIQNMKIYLDNPTLLHSGGIGYLSDEVKQTGWYQALQRADTSTILIRTSREDMIQIGRDPGIRDAFSIVRRLNFFESPNEWEKILKIELRTATLDQIFANLNLNGRVYVTNPDGNIEYTTDPAIDWAAADVPFATVQLPSDAMTFDTEFRSGYLKGWNLIGTISSDEVFSEVRKSRAFVIWLALGNLLLATLIIVWISRSMNRRLVHIVRHMKKVKNQQFDTINQPETQDEIGQLTGEFNRMTMQIRRLIHDVYMADIQKKSLELDRRQAQLNALQSQINPHFLFNALETIRMRSLIKRETETAKIIHDMAKILRSSLTWSKDKITVAEEMAFITCFLDIQQYRFGDRLTYKLDVDPEASDCLVPKMAFLPFVENASIHGIEPLKGGGLIALAIHKTGGNLIFTIRDNGKGMPPEQVDHIYGYLKRDEEIGDRVGMQNVIYRLKMIYGSRFGFFIESAPGEGTLVRIALPTD